VGFGGIHRADAGPVDIEELFMRDVVEMALEALKIARDQIVDPEYAPIGWSVYRLDEVLANGQQALAAPVQEPVAITEQMAFAFHNATTDSAMSADDLVDIMHGLKAAFAHITTPPAAQPAHEPLTDLIKAAQGVLEWTEIAHRPPMRDRLEIGRLARVRLHALADLQDALTDYSIMKGQP